VRDVYPCNNLVQVTGNALEDDLLSGRLQADNQDARRAGWSAFAESPTLQSYGDGAASAGRSRARSAYAKASWEPNGDIGGILSNVSNKFLLEGFFSVGRARGNICAILYNPA
jgi:hypothetical protein